MTLEELHLKLDLLARSGMRDSPLAAQMSRERQKTSDNLYRKIDHKGAKKEFYIQVRLFD